MPIYQYTALNNAGKTLRGKITAANEHDVELRLKSMRLDLIEAKQAKETRGGFFDRVKMQDMIVLCIHIEQLERAGVPILDAIADLRDTAETALMKQLMTDIYESIKAGDVLSVALSKHPKIFDSIFVGLVEAGEKTGNLHEVFGHLAKHLKWVNHIQARIKKATYYPIFLFFLMGGIMSLMMMFVIPKLSSFLTAQNFELPFYTKALIATSDFFVHSWYMVIIVPLVIYGLLKLFIAITPRGRYLVDRAKLSLPFVGKIIRKIELARFCRFFSIMYRSGISILECLQVASRSVKNEVIRQSIVDVRQSVAEGGSLTASLKGTGEFPSLIIRMFNVGEESGNLDIAMENVNFFYDREVDDGVNNMVGIIQPALTIVMGLVMLWISMAVFGPLYNSFSKMNF